MKLQPWLLLPGGGAILSQTAYSLPRQYGFLRSDRSGRGRAGGIPVRNSRTGDGMIEVKKELNRKNFLLNPRSERPICALAQSRTCLWVSAGPRNGEETGTVPGPNRSSRSHGQPRNRGHLEATTVRAFLVSAGCPKAGVTKEAHLHCRQCGGVSLPKLRQTERTFAARRKLKMHTWRSRSGVIHPPEVGMVRCILCPPRASARPL